MADEDVTTTYNFKLAVLSQFFLIIWVIPLLLVDIYI